MYRCKPARAPLFSCAHSIVKLRAMVIHVRVYARRLTIHIHFTQAQPCRNYRYMPRSWPYTELRNGKKRGIDQSETSSHLAHLIFSHITQGIFQCYTGWPQKTGTVNFLGLCSDQQLSFFTLLDRASFPHYNNTKIIKFG